MAEEERLPSYMAQLLDQLGWNQGTRIPLADSENQNLETILLNRQNEIQRLKESLILQNQKRDDLNKYKNQVQSEYQENTRLLFAHKQQLEQEIKLRQLALNESDILDRDVVDCNKQCKNINSRIDRLQSSIARLLKKADTLKNDVCGERGALQEWRAALERSAGDITAIEQFTKQDLSKAKALETKRLQLKVEHDKMQDRLNQLISNLNAEERACERISVQVIEGMEQRKQMMAMWTGAVENLRQRDSDIRHIREDYAVLDAELNNVAEKYREQQAFCDHQRSNNMEAQRENMKLTQQISQNRLLHQQMVEANTTLENESFCLQREISALQTMTEKLHMENRQIMETQHRKDLARKAINEKIKDLKQKLLESTDKSKSSEKRAKELEDMLNEEEHYASQITVNQQRAMHCSFVEQQKLLALKNEEKLFHMQLKASKAIMSKLASKKVNMERNILTQKESFYSISYQVETLGARVAHMEGAQTERMYCAELVEKENRLKEVCARHAARVALLERHSGGLHDDMRRLARDLEIKNTLNTTLQSRLKSSMLNVEGGSKELSESRDTWRKLRVEEALLRLRVGHAARALQGLGDTAYTLDTQRLQLEAAMNERIVEISARRDMFAVQRRALFEDCGKLRSEIRERENRIEQLKKRYDIFIGSLGKDESGQQLSVTFFKIKFAAERAMLRERGAALDAEIARRERDIAALEAALRIVHAAHTHFMHHISPLQHDAPELEEVYSLTQQYYSMRDELKEHSAMIATLEQCVAEATARGDMLDEKNKQLSVRELETENELDCIKERVSRQEMQLHNARDAVRYNAKRAKKLVEGVDEWRIFQLSLWIPDYCEAAYNAVHALAEACDAPPDLRTRFVALLSTTDLERHLTRAQRRLYTFIQRLVSGNKAAPQVKEATGFETAESVFSTSSESIKSGVSVASGYTKRLSTFRKNLAIKVQEQSLVDAIPEQARRSTVSLRVVTLGLEDSSPMLQPSSGRKSRKSLQ